MPNQVLEHYEVTYPRYDSCTLDIVADDLYLARCGNVEAQADIANKFFRKLGFDRPRAWDWSRFGFTSVTATKSETYGCTCERDCASCEQGWHQSCKYGCMFGKPVQ